MAKPEELRIGNYLNTINGIRQAIDVLCDSVNFEDIEGELYENIEPIPLTEQWLLDFGFSPSYFESGALAFWRIDGRDFLNKNMELRWFNTKIEHVHHLQNLYFALTGLELKIKEVSNG